MKKRIVRIILVGAGVVVLVLSLGLTAYAGTNNRGSERGAGAMYNPGKQSGRQYGTKGHRNQSGDRSPDAATVELTPLSQIEIDGLIYMREEEKLARDVYLVLYEKWDLRIFKNIAASEQKHMDAIKTLLDRYGLTDPAEGNEPGVFSNAKLQELYNTLIAQGSISPTDALKTGLTIEETDIDDLEQAINAATHKDITTVYGNLREGSQNHLEAFESNLARLQ